MCHCVFPNAYEHMKKPTESAQVQFAALKMKAKNVYTGWLMRFANSTHDETTINSHHSCLMCIPFSQNQADEVRTFHQPA